MMLSNLSRLFKANDDFRLFIQCSDWQSLIALEAKDYKLNGFYLKHDSASLVNVKFNHSILGTLD
jgi:hypothetical protein